VAVILWFALKGKNVTYPRVKIPHKIQITHLKFNVYKEWNSEVSIYYTYNNLKLQRLIQISRRNIKSYDYTTNRTLILRNDYYTDVSKHDFCVIFVWLVLDVLTTSYITKCTAHCYFACKTNKESIRFNSRIGGCN
jgi:hypothetical protein